MHEPLPPLGATVGRPGSRAEHLRLVEPRTDDVAPRRQALSPVVVPLVVVGLPLVLLVAGQLLSAHHVGAARSDFAVIEMATRRASSFEQVLGPYSRYGWNHPGPFLYYWNLPFWSLTGRQPGGLAFAAATLGALCLAGVVAVAHRLAGRVGAWVAVLGVLAFFARYGVDYLRRPWNPPMAVAPTALAVVLAVAVASGRPRALPWFVAAASIAFQLHIGTGPTVVVVGVAAVGLGLFAARPNLGSWTRPALAALAVTAVFWTTPLVQQAGDDGNLTALADYLDDDDREPQDRQLATRAVVKLVAGVDDDLPERTGAGITAPSVGSPSGLELLIAVTLAVTLVIGALDGGRRGDRRAVALGVVPFVALGAAVFSAVSVDDELHLYLLAFVAGTALAAWIAAGLLIAHAIGRARRAITTAERFDDGRWWTTATTALRVTVALAVLAGTRLAISSAVSPVNFVEAQGLDAADAMLDDLRARIAEVEAEEVLIRIGSSGHWSVAAAIMDRLEGDGIEIRVDDGWTFVFGDERATTGDEDIAFTVYDRVVRPAVPAALATVTSARGTIIVEGTGPQLTTPDIEAGGPGT